MDHEMMSDIGGVQTSIATSAQHFGPSIPIDDEHAMMMEEYTASPRSGAGYDDVHANSMPLDDVYEANEVQMEEYGEKDENDEGAPRFTGGSLVVQEGSNDGVEAAYHSSGVDPSASFQSEEDPRNGVVSLDSNADEPEHGNDVEEQDAGEGGALATRVEGEGGALASEVEGEDKAEEYAHTKESLNAETVQSLADEKRAEEEKTYEKHLAPALRVTFNGQDFVVFSHEESTTYVAGADEGGKDVRVYAPALAVEESVFQEPLETFFEALRVHDALGDFLDEGLELQISFEALSLSVREDDVYAREVTLEDIHRLYTGLGHVHSMHILVKEGARFISRYNELATHVASVLERKLTESGTEHASQQYSNRTHASHSNEENSGDHEAVVYEQSETNIPIAAASALDDAGDEKTQVSWPAGERKEEGSEIDRSTEEQQKLADEDEEKEEGSRRDSEDSANGTFVTVRDTDAQSNHYSPREAPASVDEDSEPQATTRDLEGSSDRSGEEEQYASSPARSDESDVNEREHHEVEEVEEQDRSSEKASQGVDEADDALYRHEELDRHSEEEGDAEGEIYANDADEDQAIDENELSANVSKGFDGSERASHLSPTRNKRPLEKDNEDEVGLELEERYEGDYVGIENDSKRVRYDDDGDGNGDGNGDGKEAEEGILETAEDGNDYTSEEEYVSDVKS